MYSLSSLLLVSCAVLSTLALPSISSPSSSSTSFVVASPSNALLRDSARLTDQLNRILFEINSVLDSDDQNEGDEGQEELEDAQEIDQSASKDPLEDLPEGDQIIGMINEAAAGEAKIEDMPENDGENDGENPSSKKTGRMVRFGRGARKFVLAPFSKGRQWYGKFQKWNSPESRLDRKHSNEMKRRNRHDEVLHGFAIGLKQAHVKELERRDQFDLKQAARREALAKKKVGS